MMEPSKDISKTGKTFLIAIILSLILGTCISTCIQGQTTDQEVLAAMIHSECGVCSTSEMYVVGSVALNRRDCNLWPSTLEDVILQGGQFHGAYTSNFTITPTTSAVAYDLINGIGRVYGVYFFTSETHPVTEFISIDVGCDFRHVFGTNPITLKFCE